MLKGSIFRSYDEVPDPAGLCDGGDYMEEVQIRIENSCGDIYMLVRPRERNEWWYAKLSWHEFFELMLKVAKESNKFKYCEY